VCVCMCVCVCVCVYACVQACMVLSGGCISLFAFMYFLVSIAVLCCAVLCCAVLCLGKYTSIGR
jgi:hypothetical protein